MVRIKRLFQTIIYLYSDNQSVSVAAAWSHGGVFCGRYRCLLFREYHLFLTADQAPNNYAASLRRAIAVHLLQLVVSNCRSICLAFFNVCFKLIYLPILSFFLDTNAENHISEENERKLYIQYIKQV